MDIERVILIVLDSCGCGEAPDAAAYGDGGSNTLGHVAAAQKGITLPHLQGLGLGNLTTILGVPPTARAAGGYGRMQEASAGKDTTTGHWEIAGLLVSESFPTFPNGFPDEMMREFRRRAGRGVLGNKTASGTAIIEELGPAHVASGELIVYTSADSVFQIAAHEEVVPIAELYRICEEARRLCDRYRIARVIARPFVGEPGSFRRTYNRRDFSLPPPAPTVLDRIAERGLPVVGIGKIWDIYGGRGITANVHSEGNRDGLERLLAELEQTTRGLIFLNLVDFDMLYGHRRDPAGYRRALKEFDDFLPDLTTRLGSHDLVLLTADHGNDPTFRGTDHTRELVPVLAFGTKTRGADLGLRRGFFDIAQTLAEAFRLPRWERGTSFLGELGPRA